MFCADDRVKGLPVFSTNNLFQSAMQMFCADDFARNHVQRLPRLFQSAMQMFCADDGTLSGLSWGVLEKFQSAMQMFCADDSMVSRGFAPSCIKFQSAMQMFCADDRAGRRHTGAVQRFQSAMQMFCADDLETAWEAWQEVSICDADVLR